MTWNVSCLVGILLILVSSWHLESSTFFKKNYNLPPKATCYQSSSLISEVIYHFSYIDQWILKCLGKNIQDFLVIGYRYYADPIVCILRGWTFYMVFMLFENRPRLYLPKSAFFKERSNLEIREVWRLFWDSVGLFTSLSYEYYNFSF